MIALTIIIVLLVLLLIMPVGADVSFIGGEFKLRVKIGPVGKLLFPPKDKKKEKTKKPKKEKPDKGGGKKKLRLGFDDITAIAKIGLKALKRFRHCLSIDLFMLHLTAAAEDPYDAVMAYGYVNAGIGALMPLAHSALKIRDEDIQIRMDFTEEMTSADARLVATLQIWEILYIAILAVAAFLKWYMQYKKRIKAEAKQAMEEKGI